MSISLDGFVAGPNTSAENPLGEGGERLHHWLFADPQDPRDVEVVKEQREAVGAVVLGRRTFDIGVDIWGDVPYPAPCFVLTHRPHTDVVMTSGSFTFITGGVVEAVEAAKAAAGPRTVQVMGGETVQQVVAAGLLDELALNLVPLLMGNCVRMFDRLAADHIELVRTRIIDSDRVTHLRFSVVTA
jgi:dihydrofolate reductase